MCACSKASRQPRPTRSATTITRNSPLATSQVQSVPRSSFIQGMDPERLRVEQLRREAIRKSFGEFK